MAREHLRRGCIRPDFREQRPAGGNSGAFGERDVKCVVEWQEQFENLSPADNGDRPGRDSDRLDGGVECRAAGQGLGDEDAGRVLIADVGLGEDVRKNGAGFGDDAAVGPLTSR